ncbi:hypothetical protein [Pseudomonas sp. zbq_11]|uniref:hypothetical protein n=1 Tax=unclassified Pseudomonas TaxID=196821 RepID=UPI00370A83E4
MRRISHFNRFILLTGALPFAALAQSAEQPPTDSDVELPALNINADVAVLGSDTEGTGAYTVGQTSAATRLPLTVKETPPGCDRGDPPAHG